MKFTKQKFRSILHAIALLSVLLFIPGCISLKPLPDTMELELEDAVTAAKLVNDQTLLLDNTLAELIPDLAGRIEHADAITLKLMLQHRSGIPDFIDFDFDWNDPPQENREILELVLDKPAEFSEG